MSCGLAGTISNLIPVTFNKRVNEFQWNTFTLLFWGILMPYSAVLLLSMFFEHGKLQDGGMAQNLTARLRLALVICCTTAYLRLTMR